MKSKYLLLAFLIFMSFRELAAQTTITLQPGPEGKDALLNSYFNSNYGDYPNLFAIGWTHSGTPFVTRSIMDFDLSDIPGNAVILEARLSLFFAINANNPGLYQTSGNHAFIRKVTTPWNEYGVTWDNQPATSDDFEVRLSASQSPEQNYPDIDVTGLINDKYLNPSTNHGMMLILENEYPYHAMCFASGDHENKNLRPKLVITYKLCPPPQVSFNYTIDGQKVFFNAISPTAESFFWDFGDGYFSNLPDPVHEYQMQGSYEVCLQVSDSCGMAEHCEIVDICDYPVANFSFSSLDLTVYFENNSIFPEQYFWSFGDGYYSDLADPWHTYDTTGYYYVYLITRNECGADTACQVIYVNYSWINEQGNAEFSVYPNPAVSQISISSQQPAAKMIIADMFGRVRDEFENITAFPFQIDVSAYQEGMCIIRILTTDNQSKTIKFLKLREK